MLSCYITVFAQDRQSFPATSGGWTGLLREHMGSGRHVLSLHHQHGVSNHDFDENYVDDNYGGHLITF